jgi:hypothetical protein
MLQAVVDRPLEDWFEYMIGPPMMDLTAAPYGGARYPSKLEWMHASSLDSISMLESATW